MELESKNLRTKLFDYVWKVEPEINWIITFLETNKIAKYYKYT